MNQEFTNKMALEAENLALEIKNWLNRLGDNMTSDEERVLLNAIQVLQRYAQTWS